MPKVDVRFCCCESNGLYPMAPVDVVALPASIPRNPYMLCICGTAEGGYWEGSFMVLALLFPKVFAESIEESCVVPS